VALRSANTCTSRARHLRRMQMAKKAKKKAKKKTARKTKKKAARR
jgi:hypothetical protein